MTATASVTRGEVTAVDRGTIGPGLDARILNHTGSVNPGNSGGPLFNGCGEVVGVNTLKANPAAVSNVSIALSSAEAVPFLLAHGVSAKTSEAICYSKPQDKCVDDSATIEQEIAVGRLDSAQRLISNAHLCPDASTRVVKTYIDTLQKISKIQDLVTGLWRMPDGTCGNGVSLDASGLAILAEAGDVSQYEAIVGLSPTSLSTRADSDGAAPTEYSYAATEGALTIQNKTEKKSWSLQRCAN